MNRRLRTLLLMLGLLWQPLASLFPAEWEARAERLSHAVVHGQAVGHHHDHHDEASQHPEADEGGPHHHGLDVGQPPGLPARPASVDVVRPPGGFVAADPSMPPSALLEAPLRPPRTHRV